MPSNPDNRTASRMKNEWVAQVWQTISLPVAAVILALLIGAVILSFQGIHPLHANGSLLKGAFGNPTALGRTLEKATPLVFSGVAICGIR